MDSSKEGRAIGASSEELIIFTVNVLNKLPIPFDRYSPCIRKIP